jgi:diadenosine tetraphosphate (Ap4A) HIT family hydrolase
VFNDRLWSADALISGVPGSVVLLTRRHAEGLESLQFDELTTLGPIMKLLSSAIARATGAERVYFVTYMERFAHFHVLLIPRVADIPPPHRGPALQAQLGAYANREAAETFAHRIRRMANSLEVPEPMRLDSQRHDV